MHLPDISQLKTAAVLATVLLLSACGGSAGGPAVSSSQQVLRPELGEMSATEREALLLEEQGQLVEAANVYLNASREVTAPLSDEYLLRGAQLLAKAGDSPRAWAALQALSPVLPETTEKRRRLIAGELYLADGRGLEVLNVLPHDPEGLTREQYQTLLSLRGQAYFESGAPYEGARDLVERQQYLDTPEQGAENHRLLWRKLISTQRYELENGLQRSMQSAVLRGWFQLAQLSQNRWLNDEGYMESWLSWQEANPGHPATLSLLPELIEASAAQSSFPSKITLMVPLSGRYARAGIAIRDGLLASWYDSGEMGRATVIDVVDTAATSELTLEDQLRQLYAQAVNGGSELVIGPLRKEAIAALSVLNTRPVPILALNNVQHRDDRWSSVSDMPEQLKAIYQLGLSPELEAGLAASRASLDGHRRALVLVPRGSWGERVYTEFSRVFASHGGTVVGAEYYESRDNDFSTPIKRILHLGRSSGRAARLQRSLALDLKSEPRRRQDADMVFIGAFPRQARLLRPQLKFHRASKLPVYATSHLFTGVVDSASDRDMDGIRFSDMPWMLDQGNQRYAHLKSQISAADPNSFEQNARLYALGVDAFRLAPLIVHSALPGTWFIGGATGMLSLDENGTIQRNLVWAQFESGKPARLGELVPPAEPKQGMRLEGGLSFNQ